MKRPLTRAFWASGSAVHGFRVLRVQTVNRERLNREPLNPEPLSLFPILPIMAGYENPVRQSRDDTV